jgi:hypothetical protein
MLVRRNAIYIAGAIALAVGGLVAWQHHVQRQSVVSYARQTAEDGAMAFARVAMSPLTSFSDPADLSVNLAQRMDTRSTGPPEDVANADTRSLHRAVADFLYYRFLQDSPARYREWREQHGYRARTIDEMIAREDLDYTYTLFTGRKLPPDITPQQAFDKLWGPSLEYGSGFNRPVSVAVDRRGLTTVLGWWTSSNQERVSVEGELSRHLWRGGTAANMRSWWKPRLDAQELITRDTRVMFAEVGLLVEYADGTRRPMVMSYARDPQLSEWLLLHVTAYNFPSGSPLSPLEY